MKKQAISIFGNSVRKTMLALSLSAFFMMSTFPVLQAQDGNEPLTPVSVRYIGLIDQQPVFQVEFDNKDEKTFQIAIRDEDGNVLYNEKAGGSRFSKKFQIEKPGLDNMKLSITLTRGKEKQTQVFEINSNVRVIQDVVVTKL
jgi:hypothetical protein